MFHNLDEINKRPAPFSVYTAKDLWIPPHRAEQMLAFHLNEAIDVSSRSKTFMDASADWIIRHFSLGPDTSVCDFGCGPGLYAARLARSGARLTGLDFSETTLRYAREQAAVAGQSITYIQTDYLEFTQASSFDLITMIMCDICALSPAQRARLLSRMHSSLKPGAALLLDVYAIPAFRARDEVSFYEKNQLNHFWFQEDYHAFVNTFKYHDDAVILDKYSLFPETGAPETVYNWLQYFSPDTLKTELCAAGFIPETTYKDVAGAPFDPDHTEFAMVARKPS